MLVDDILETEREAGGRTAKSDGRYGEKWGVLLLESLSNTIGGGVSGRKRAAVAAGIGSGCATSELGPNGEAGG